MQGSYLAMQNNNPKGNNAQEDSDTKISPRDIKIQMAAEENDNYIDKVRPKQPTVRDRIERKPMTKVPVESDNLDRHVPEADMSFEEEHSPFLLNDTSVEHRPNPGRQTNGQIQTSDDSAFSTGTMEAPPNYNSVVSRHDSVV